MKKFLLILLLFSLNTSNVYSLEADVFIQSTVNRAAETLNSSFTKEQRIKKLKEIAKETVDIKGIGFYSLGTHRKDLNKDQLKNYLNNYNFSVEELKKKIEIENEWKNLIYARYSKSIKIDHNFLINKIEKISEEEFSLEYNLSEIVFTKKQNISLEEQSKKIIESIEINGFENTANLYSITDSSKAGGRIGWVKKNNLSIEINSELENLKINSYTNPIKIGNNYLILKISDMKEVAVEFDKQKELDRMIMSETSKQLDKFSNIFYNKIKLNSSISEF